MKGGLWLYCRKGMRPFSRKHAGVHAIPAEFVCLAPYGVRRFIKGHPRGSYRGQVAR